MQMTAGQGRSGWMGCTRMTQQQPAGHDEQDGAGVPGDVIDDEVVDVTDLVHAQELVIDDAVEELEAARAEEQSRQAQAARAHACRSRRRASMKNPATRMISSAECSRPSESRPMAGVARSKK